MDLSNIEPQSHEGNTNEWFTPRWILDACGAFDLDPCGDSRWETAPRIFEERGLEQRWSGRVWLNPPYGRTVGQWLSALAEHGDGLALIFARTDTKWFHDVIDRTSWVLFLKRRVKFVVSGTLLEAERNPGAPSMLMAFGSQPIPKLEGWVATSEPDVESQNS